MAAKFLGSDMISGFVNTFVTAPGTNSRPLGWNPPVETQKSCKNLSCCRCVFWQKASQHMAGASVCDPKRDPKMVRHRGAG
eukprot:700889-Karenia_brevis.AAC.1